MKKLTLVLSVLFSFNSLCAQNARDGSTSFGANNTGCNSANGEPCLRIKIPYDENGTVSGSPENCWNSPKGALVPIFPSLNYEYVLIFNDEFTNIDLIKDTDFIWDSPNNQTFYQNGIKWIKRTDEVNNPNVFPTNAVMEETNNCCIIENDVNNVNDCGNSTVDKKLKLVASKNIAANGSTLFKVSELRSTFNFKYGYIEGRIKIPRGKGYWPAFWTYSSKGCSNLKSEYYHEFDIFEFFQDGNQSIPKPFDYQKMFITQHYSPNPPCTEKLADISQIVVPMDENGTNSAFFLDFSKDFFIYGMEWTPSQTKYYVNNVLVHTQITKNNILNQYVLLTNFLRPNFTDGKAGVDNNTPFPGYMEVDYIRVYKTKNEWLNMISGSSEMCLGETVNFSVDANIPGASYSWTITNNATPSLTLTPIFDYNSGNRSVNIWAPLNAPSGNYNLRLIVTMPDGTILPTVDKIITIPNPSVISPQPSIISVNNFCDFCLLNINPIPNITKYEWLLDNALLSNETTAYLDIGTYTNGRVKVRAKYNCSQWSSFRTKSTFMCGGVSCSGGLRLEAVTDSFDTAILQDRILITDKDDTPDSLNDITSIYPNPANLQQNDFITIELPKSDCNTDISLFDASGICIQKYHVRQDLFRVPTRDLAAGVYLLNIQSFNSHQIVKIIILP